MRVRRESILGQGNSICKGPVAGHLRERRRQGWLELQAQLCDEAGQASWGQAVQGLLHPPMHLA
jgi:hypothetical protein